MTTQRTEPDNSQAAQDAKIELLEALPDLSSHRLLALRAFLRIIKADQSNLLTPIEEFITTLPFRYEYAAHNGSHLTPDDLVRMIEDPNDGVRADFDQAIEIARHYNARYARIVTAETADISKTAEEDEGEEI